MPKSERIETRIYVDDAIVMKLNLLAKGRLRRHNRIITKLLEDADPKDFEQFGPLLERQFLATKDCWSRSIRLSPELHAKAAQIAQGGPVSSAIRLLILETEEGIE